MKSKTAVIHEAKFKGKLTSIGMDETENPRSVIECNDTPEYSPEFTYYSDKEFTKRLAQSGLLYKDVRVKITLEIQEI